MLGSGHNLFCGVDFIYSRLHALPILLTISEYKETVRLTSVRCLFVVFKVHGLHRFAYQQKLIVRSVLLMTFSSTMSIKESSIFSPQERELVALKAILESHLNTNSGGLPSFRVASSRKNHSDMFDNS